MGFLDLRLGDSSLRAPQLAHSLGVAKHLIFGEGVMRRPLSGLSGLSPPLKVRCVVIFRGPDNGALVRRK